MKTKKELHFQKKLARLRLQIDKADHALIKALGRRSKVVEKIGAAKKTHGEPFQQKNRWTQLMRDRKRQAREHGVDQQLIVEIFDSIQKESISRQARAKSKGKKR